MWVMSVKGYLRSGAASDHARGWGEVLEAKRTPLKRHASMSYAGGFACSKFPSPARPVIGMCAHLCRPSKQCDPSCRDEVAPGGNGGGVTPHL